MGRKRCLLSYSSFSIMIYLLYLIQVWQSTNSQSGSLGKTKKNFPGGSYLSIHIEDLQIYVYNASRLKRERKRRRYLLRCQNIFDMCLFLITFYLPSLQLFSVLSRVHSQNFELSLQPSQSIWGVTLCCVAVAGGKSICHTCCDLHWESDKDLCRFI